MADRKVFSKAKMSLAKQGCGSARSNHPLQNLEKRNEDQSRDKPSGRDLADLVFLQESLSAVPQAIALTRGAGRLVRQNLALAVLYNLAAVPIAILGYVTPHCLPQWLCLGSSIVVVANALRLTGRPTASRARPKLPRAVLQTPRS